MRLAAALAVVACTGCGRIAFETVDDASDGSVGDAVDAPPNMNAEVCPAIPVMGTTTRVTTVAELQAALSSGAPDGSTILIANGNYSITSTLVVGRGLTLRSESGNADDVRLNGSGAIPMIYLVDSNTRVISLTISAGDGEGIHVMPMGATDISNMLIYDVTLSNHMLPFVRIRPENGQLGTGPYADSGTVACSRFIASTVITGCGDATGAWAINADAAAGWTIANNVFDQRACVIGGTRTIWFDSGSKDTFVSSNTFLDTNQGIMFGGGTGGRTYIAVVPTECSGTLDHLGGVICNNVIASLSPASQSNEDFEEGIALWNACDTYVMHNTVLSQVGAETFTNLEYRYAGTWVHLVNNFSAVAPLLRDGAAEDPAYTASNQLLTSPTMFADPSTGDLRPATGQTFPLGTNISAIGQCQLDVTGKPRSLTTPTVGAFEP